MLSQFTQPTINDLLDSYNSCKRLAKRYMSDQKLKNHERIKRYRAEIFDAFDTKDVEWIKQTIDQIKDVIINNHKMIKNHLKN